MERSSDKLWHGRGRVGAASRRLLDWGSFAETHRPTFNVPR